MNPTTCPICNQLLISADSYNFMLSCPNKDYTFYHTSESNMESILIEQFKLFSVINVSSRLTLITEEGFSIFLATLPYLKPTNKESMLLRFNTIKTFL